MPILKHRKPQGEAPGPAGTKPVLPGSSDKAAARAKNLGSLLAVAGIHTEKDLVQWVYGALEARLGAEKAQARIREVWAFKPGFRRAPARDLETATEDKHE